MFCLLPVPKLPSEYYQPYFSETGNSKQCEFIHNKCFQETHLAECVPHTLSLFPALSVSSPLSLLINDLSYHISSSSYHFHKHVLGEQINTYKDMRRFHREILFCKTKSTSAFSSNILFLFIFLCSMENPLNPSLLPLPEAKTVGMPVTCIVIVYVCSCTNSRLVVQLNEPSGFGMHRSLLLCTMQQAAPVEALKGTVPLRLCLLNTVKLLKHL